MPKTVDEALQIDREAGTDHWRCAINKEMARVKVAWIARKGCNPDDVRKGKVSEMIGYHDIGCHLIFDVNMDFSRKAPYVAGGHTTEAPAAMS
eukprot:5253889-Ditylum_brightwellii.AAC.1